MPRKPGSVTKTFTFDGKRYFVTGENEVDAEVKKAMKLRDMEEGKIKITSGMTVGRWCEECIEKYKTNLADVSLSRYKNRMDRWIVDKIGYMRLKDVKPLHCQNIMNQLEGYSKFQINAVAQMLNFIFDRAIENDLLIKNPAANLTKPKGTYTKGRSITETEREHVLKVADSNPRYIYFLFMLFCGCRPSEAAKIRGMDIKTIEGRNILHIRGTKTELSDRMVPLPDYISERLPEISPFDYFITNTRGEAMSQGNYTDLWRSFKRQLNISMGCKVYRNQLMPPYPLAEDFRPYFLRHTYCTNLQKSGVDIRTAQYLMGHSDISITANIYTHADNQTIIDAADKLNGTTHGTTPIHPKAN